MKLKIPLRSIDQFTRKDSRNLIFLYVHYLLEIELKFFIIAEVEIIINSKPKGKF